MSLQIIGRALAQSTCSTKVTTDISPDGVCNITDYINALLPAIYGIIGGLAVLMIIYSGYIYMTSQGAPDKISLAKDIIIGVITGIALLFLMGLILSTVGIK